MRIAIFGGSFDPVHTEHIRFARKAIEQLNLDKLFVMPAAAPPHKPGKILSLDGDRLAMCRLAFENEPKAEVCDYEIARGGTSYTYLTCRHFRETYPSSEIYWLVGTDMLRDFPTWKEPLSILKDVTLAVCARAEENGWLERERAAFKAKFETDFTVVDYNGLDVSSTKIRVTAGAGGNVAEYVGEKVAEYIKARGLYEIPGASAALALEKPSRKAHTLRVAETAAKKAVEMRLSERKAIAAALFHDCAKNLGADSPYLDGFVCKEEWGEVPPPVLHQFTGAYVAERAFGVTDGEILDAIRYHTSGKPNMTELGKLVFLADMVEYGREFEGVGKLRSLFWAKKGVGALDECLIAALEQTLSHVREKGEKTYPLTLRAYEYYRREIYDENNE